MEKNTKNLSLYDFIEDDIDSDYEEYGIANQLYKGNIDLNPLFQRRDAWNDKEKSKLIESLMLGIPVPYNKSHTIFYV